MFFSGLAAYANGACYVIACFFFGTLVASLRHSGFCIPWVLACPGFFFRIGFFFPFWLDLITCNRVSFGGNVCCPVLAHFFFNWTFLHACLKSCHRYHQCTALLHDVASRNGQLGVMSRYVMSCHVLLRCLAHPGFLRPDRAMMYSSDSDLTSDDSASDCLEDSPVDAWHARASMAINEYPVSLRREQDLSRSQAGRLAAVERCKEEFFDQYEFGDVQEDSIINTPEAEALRLWC